MTPADGPQPLDGTLRRRSTRDRPAKAPLSRDAVVEAAMAILQSEGLRAVTMRRVASALDTGAASLYVYVSGSEGLLQAMLDRVVATIDLEPPDPVRWRAQVRSLLQRMFQAFVAHPGMAAMTLADPPSSEPVLRLTENMLGLLLAGGFDPQEAAWTCDIFVLLVKGRASEDGVRHRRGQSDDERRQQIDELGGTFAALPIDRFPLVVAHARQLVAGDSDERFRFAVDAVIDGVAARAPRPGDR